MPPGLPRPIAAVARRLAPPPAGTDADLLARFRFGRDEAAFAALVRRHGPAVRAVARARLGNPADADDVVQATFLVLARDATKVRESVAGWLVRVAQLTALQHRRNLARRRTDPLPEGLPVHADPVDAAAAREDRAVVVEELAGLPDKLRAVLVLCALEGLTAAEAAVRLGVPKGTVDSRLATAKRRLADRLARRGLAAGSGVVALEALAADVAVAGSSEVAFAITAAAVEYAAAGAGFAPTPVSLLADGVRSAMTSTARLFALGMVAAAVTGTAGTALYHAGPADKPDDTKPAAKPASPPKPDTPPPAATSTVNPNAGPARLTSEADVRERLARPSDIRDLSAITLGTLLTELEFGGLNTRIDLPALLRAGMPEDMLNGLRDHKLRSFGGSGTSLGDQLSDVTAGVTWGEAAEGGRGSKRLTYRVSGNRVVLGPAYQTPSLPGSGGTNDFQPVIEREQMIEQVVGPPVSFAADGLMLAAAVKRLRALTGANIVVDARAKEKADALVAGTFDDVRLLTVLQVLADQAGLKPVTLNNVYYLTTVENAAPLQLLADRDLFGLPRTQPLPLAEKK